MPNAYIRPIFTIDPQFEKSNLMEGSCDFVVTSAWVEALYFGPVCSISILEYAQGCCLCIHIINVNIQMSFKDQHSFNYCTRVSHR